MITYKIKYKIYRYICIVLVVNIFTSILLPTVSFALTGGPTAPEFSDFEPVVATDMVNTFTGDFSYNLPVINVPGPDGSGYAMSLSYHSGVNAEEEASWVGYGWTLNPGSINRGVRGIPDDYKETNIHHFNKGPVSWSVSSGKRAGIEVLSKDNNDIIVGASLSTTKSYNNFQGISKFWSMGVSSSYIGNLNVTGSPSGPTFGLTVNPMALLSFVSNEVPSKEASTIRKFLYKLKQLREQYKKFTSYSKTYSKTNSKNEFTISGSIRRSKGALFVGSHYGLFAPGMINQSTRVNHYSGFQFNYGQSVSSWYFLPIGLEVGSFGSVSAQGNSHLTEASSSGYMYNPTTKSALYSDYYLEKEGVYNRRNKFLSIPFSNSDIFMASGEELTGGFKLVHDQAGHYYPNPVNSSVKIANGGPSLGVGPTVTLGASILNGNSKFTQDGWAGGNINYSANLPVARFFGDPAGDLNYATTIEPSVASIDEGIGNIAKFGGKDPVFNNLSLNENTGKASEIKRSSYIEYHTYGMNKNNPGLAFCKDTEIKGFLNDYYTATDSRFDSHIAEFSITNESGLNYVYGLPSYVKNESSIQTKIEDLKYGRNGNINKQLPPDFLFSNSFEFDQNYKPSLSNKTVMGEYKPVPYSQNTLLTEIYTPDYYDVSNNGPSFDDFGGWTRFRYRKVYGDNNWYRWRIPYNYNHLQKNNISTKTDDLASFSTGEKEVYYVKAIDTKTHVAFFITNKTKPEDFSSYFPNGVPSDLLASLTGLGDREDGLAAARIPNGRDFSDPCAIGNCKTNENNKIEKLDRIVLFSKNDFSKSLKTVYFKYNYSLCKNLPNSSTNQGKLTLEKIWTEADGVVKTRTSPYIFKYNYKKDYPERTKAQYPFLDSNSPLCLTCKVSEESENPEYRPDLIDPWGFIKYDGANRTMKLQDWNYQGKLPETFDPAAYHLKQIILPSGGEIQIQYEEKNYQYVQDKKALGFASLSEGPLDKYNPDQNFYPLNLADIGIDVTNEAEVLEQFNLLKALENNFIYFKFLYALKGGNANLKVNINGVLRDNPRAEYIKGYIKVRQVIPTYTENKVTGIGLRLGMKRDENEREFGYDENAVPKQVCFSYVLTQRGGVIESDNGVIPNGIFIEGFDKEINNNYADNESNLKESVERIGGKRDLYKGLIQSFGEMITYNIPDKDEVREDKQDYCAYLNHELSYLRIPMLKAKRGDGVRVKRLLMLDNGLEALHADAAVYGNEYIYENEDGTSSGVATNEPQSSREENALVTLIDKSKQKFLDKIVAGKNILEYEGPLGESIMPAPSVGHARIIVKNIHEGKSGGGFTEYKYHTIKDAPISPDFTFNAPGSELDGKKAVSYTNLKDNQMRIPLILPLGLIDIKMVKEVASQGYSFNLYNIHGSLKSTFVYSGNYTNSNDFAKGKFPKISGQQLDYFHPGEELKMLNADGTYSLMQPGKDMEVAMESKEVTESTSAPSYDFDIGLVLPVLPIIKVSYSGVLSYSGDKSFLKTHVNSKVTNYPAIVKGTTSLQDGVVTRSENLAFNKFTGQPVLTCTYDAFHNVNILDQNQQVVPHDGTYYNLNVPAALIPEYETMGPKYKDTQVKKFTNELNATALSITTYGAEGNPLRPAGATGTWAFKNVISGEVQTYEKFTFDEPVLSEFFPGNVDKSKIKNKLRPSLNYIFNEQRKESDNIIVNSNRIYNGGTSKTTVPFFNYANPSANGDQWLLTNKVTLYSPNGNALEEEDIVGIPSTIVFGFGQTVPVVVAGNSKYGNVNFRSFEDDQEANIVTNGFHQELFAHSGNKYLNLITATPFKVFGAFSKPGRSLINDRKIFNKGAVVKFWKAGKSNDITVKLNAESFVPNEVASSGVWKLYEVHVPGSFFQSLAEKAPFELSVANMSPTPASEDLLIDDVRFEPYESQVTCYVYDNNLRLLASFDTQHFGMFYQYNQEGKLVRKIKETERGNKTLQETQYNTPLTAK